jgi:hypothetical protein
MSGLPKKVTVKVLKPKRATKRVLRKKRPPPPRKRVTKAVSKLVRKRTFTKGPKANAYRGRFYTIPGVRMSSAINRYLECVFNPIHCELGAQSISLSSASGIPIIDYITNAADFPITVNTSQGSPAVQSFMLVFMYGSCNTESDDIQDASGLAYRVWVLPFLASGDEDVLYDETTTPSSIPYLEFTNYAQNLTFANTMQIVGAGIQVKPLVETITSATSSDQFISNMCAGQPTLESVLNAMGGTFSQKVAYELVKTGTPSSDYSNSEGASARYFLGQDVNQFRYYDMDTLCEFMNSETQTQPLDAASLKAPCIFTKFNVAITGLSSTISRNNYLRGILEKEGLLRDSEINGSKATKREATEPKCPFDMGDLKESLEMIVPEKERNQKRDKMIQAYINNLKEEERQGIICHSALTPQKVLKYKSYLKQLRLDIIKLENALKRNVMGTDYTFVYPCKFFARVLMDVGVTQPSGMTVNPNPTCPQFNEVMVWMAKKSLTDENYALISNGHSFKSFLRSSGKFLTNAPRYLGDGINIAQQFKRQINRGRKLFS